MFEGGLTTGEREVRPFGPGFTFVLTPIQRGWEISVTHESSAGNIARLTPPWHFVPNPRYIEGWHFRNASNTGPNDGSVNAPQEHREFIFSPEVNQTIDGTGSNRDPTLEEMERIRQFGQGRLEVLKYDLTRPKLGERASMVRLHYRVCLSWPRDFS